PGPRYLCPREQVFQPSWSAFGNCASAVGRVRWIVWRIPDDFLCGSRGHPGPRAATPSGALGSSRGDPLDLDASIVAVLCAVDDELGRLRPGRPRPNEPRCHGSIVAGRDDEGHQLEVARLAAQWDSGPPTPGQITYW